MQGGAKAYLSDILQRHSDPINMYVLAFLIIVITFVKQVPVNYRRYAESFFGRILLFSLTIAVGHYYSWTNGLLMALITLLLLSLSPRNREGFQSEFDSKIKMITGKKHWWIENVFHENPIGIEEDKVKTSAIQDGSTSQSTQSK
jgi:glucose-6-phosphate-specific signal transduction histidine kinase